MAWKLMEAPAADSMVAFNASRIRDRDPVRFSKRVSVKGYAKRGIVGALCEIMQGPFGNVFSIHSAS